MQHWLWILSLAEFKPLGFLLSRPRPRIFSLAEFKPKLLLSRPEIYSKPAWGSTSTPRNKKKSSDLAELQGTPFLGCGVLVHPPAPLVAPLFIAAVICENKSRRVGQNFKGIPRRWWNDDVIFDCFRWRDCYCWFASLPGWLWLAICFVLAF